MQIRLTALCNAAWLPNLQRRPKIRNSYAPKRLLHGWAFRSDHSTSTSNKVFCPAISSVGIACSEKENFLLLWARIG
jgi:hypothetical protein